MSVYCLLFYLFIILLKCFSRLFSRLQFNSLGHPIQEHQKNPSSSRPLFAGSFWLIICRGQVYFFHPFVYLFIQPLILSTHVFADSVLCLVMRPGSGVCVHKVCWTCFSGAAEAPHWGWAMGWGGGFPEAVMIMQKSAQVKRWYKESSRQRQESAGQ